VSAVAADPEISFRKIASLIWRAWPFYRPQLKHVITFLLINVSSGGLLLTGGLVGNDLFNNKVMLGQPLQPLQASLLFLDDSYVAEVTEPLAETTNSAAPDLKTGAAETPDAEKGAAETPLMTDEQRQTVRDRLFVWAIFAVAISAILLSLGWYYMVWIFQMINQDLRVAMLERAENLSLRFHDQARTGDAIYRVYQDSATITNVLQQLVITPLRAVIWLAWGIILVSFFSPWLGLLCLLTVIPIAVLFSYCSPRIRRSAQRARQTNSDLTSRIQETFSAIRVVKANRAESRVIDQFNVDSRAALDAAYDLRMNIILLTMGIAIVATAILFGAEYLMANWTISKSATYLGGVVTLVGFAVWNLGAYQSAAGTLAQSAEQGTDLAQLWGGAQDLIVGLQRAYFLLDLEPEVTEPEDPVLFPMPIERVSWQNVAFRYADNPILTSVNLQASRGTVTAIVGSTGSGKSTLMSLLLRLYDPDEGDICINDTPLGNLSLESLRGNVAIALQQNVLFTMTIAENIAYACRNPTREQIEAAAVVSCADDFIREMPQGYDTELGERGGKLSTGQRQRLSIARAILRDTPILILDEPTASLDAETEHRVLRNIAEWGRERIVFLITHRLSTIRSADQIAFLDDGVIAELGSHDELISMDDGHYRRFVDAELHGSAAHG
jgi:ABC-type multidrug transport system fused ATPase/permease subunit